MLSSCEELNIPIITTEQAKNIFGETVNELKSNKSSVYEKTQFSMCIDKVFNKIRKYDTIDKPRKNIILVGIEAHICVLQTVIDLLKYGYNIHLIIDAIGSNRKIDQKYAIKRMENAGAILTTSESMVFQLLRDSNHPKFRKIQRFVKKHIQDIKRLSKSKL